MTTNNTCGIPTIEDLAIHAGIIASQMCGEMENKKAIAYRIIDLAKWYAATGKDIAKVPDAPADTPPVEKNQLERYDLPPEMKFQVAPKKPHKPDNAFANVAPHDNHQD